MTGDFYGQPTESLSSEHLRLEYLAGAGPRIVRLFVPGVGENILAETPAIHWDTPSGKFTLFGGHRLWLAPESVLHTYVPDSSGLVIDRWENGVRLTQPAAGPLRIEKSIEIRLDPHHPAASLTHRLHNRGGERVRLAPWAITQLTSGGTAALPQPVGPIDAHGLLPNRNIVLWPYSRWSDQRLRIHDRAVFIQASPADAPLKLGCFNHPGWLAYLTNQICFCKRFAPHASKPHPDFGCNTEVYAKGDFLELETLGPLEDLEPGEESCHQETWEVYRADSLPSDLAEIFQLFENLKPNP